MEVQKEGSFVGRKFRRKEGRFIGRKFTRKEV